MPTFLAPRRSSPPGHEIVLPSLGRPDASVRRLLRATLRYASFPGLVAFLRFALVGLSGVIVNLGILATTLSLSARHPSAALQATAETTATQVAILWNFALTELWVFPTGETRAPRWLRLGGYWLASMITLGVQLPLTAALVRLFPVDYLVATALALAVLVVGRFVVCRVVLYRPRVAARSRGVPAVGGVTVDMEGSA
jgi:putative flippase GtrA